MMPTARWPAAMLLLALSGVAWAQTRPALESVVTASVKPSDADVESHKPVYGPAGVKAIHNQEYVANGGAARSLDLFVPEKAKEPVPVIMWVHGGAWAFGSKDYCPALAAIPRGFAVASINYRLTSQAVFPAQIEDCKAAVRWLRANAKKYNLDPNRIGVCGDSAGGHLVALLGTSGDVKEFDGPDGGNPAVSARVQAVCDFYGPTDLLHIAEDSNRPDRDQINAPTSPVYKLLGGTLVDKHDLAVLANPITFVSKDDPPFLIIHGDADAIVPLVQSKILDEALKKAGVSSEFITVKGGGHGLGVINNSAVIAKVSAFFEAKLKKPAVAESKPLDNKKS